MGVWSCGLWLGQGRGGGSLRVRNCGRRPKTPSTSEVTVDSSLSLSGERGLVFIQVSPVPLFRDLCLYCRRVLGRLGERPTRVEQNVPRQARPFLVPSASEGP